jgi:hypothetical protein
MHLAHTPADTEGGILVGNGAGISGDIHFTKNAFLKFFPKLEQALQLFGDCFIQIL